MNALEPALEKARKTADTLVDWMGNQNYQGEPLLHAIVCCDFVSGEHFKNAIAKEIARALLTAEKEALESLKTMRKRIWAPDELDGFQEIVGGAVPMWFVEKRIEEIEKCLTKGGNAT